MTLTNTTANSTQTVAYQNNGAPTFGLNGFYNGGKNVWGLFDQGKNGGAAYDLTQVQNGDGTWNPYGAIRLSPLNGYVIASQQVVAPAFVASGTAPTNSGSCAITTQLGGPTAGSFKASGACPAGTYILALGQTSANGWACSASDLTTVADTVQETAYTTSSVTFKATTANNDLITFSCTGF